MANIKSAKKRIKVSIRNTERNKSVRSEIKTFRKKVEDLLKGNAENKTAELNKIISRIDSAVSKGVFHKNKAARLKSRLAKKAAVKK